MRREDEQLVEITVEVGGHKQTCENEIKRVCMVEWAFRTEDFFHRTSDDRKHQLLEASALGTLYGGEDADDIIQRIERAVWRANGGMCHVEVRAVNYRHPSECKSLIDPELQVA